VLYWDAARAGVTLAVYPQYAYDREKLEALDLWAARLAAIVGDQAAVEVSYGLRDAL